MSEQHQLQQRVASTTTTNTVAASTKSQATVEDNFDAMRHAAMSMFKQRTKDLTMVSSLTLEAQGLEQINCQVQSTINQLQEQKALLEAQIETEECRVKERERQLREVHTMLAQMNEDQSVFSGVQRASETVTMTLHRFVTQYTAKGSELTCLLERSHERTQGRAPNEWRAITNDLRRRQSILDEHIKHIERHQTVPHGFRDLLVEWSHGVWKQHPECGPAICVCEQLLCYDASEQLCQLLPSLACIDGSVVWEDSEVYADTCVRELDALLKVGATIEKEGEGVGLCCDVVSDDRIKAIRLRWSAIFSFGASLRETTAASKSLSARLEEQNASVKLLLGRVVSVDMQIQDVESNLQQETATAQNEMEMHDGLLTSWKKALETALGHMQCEVKCESEVSVNKYEETRLEVELNAKTTGMETQWLTFHNQIAQLYSLLCTETQQAAEAVCLLNSETDEQEAEEGRLNAVRDAYMAFEEALREDCDDMENNVPPNTDDFSQIEGDEVKDPSRATVINNLLQQLLQYQQEQQREEKDEVNKKDDVLGLLLTSTELDADLFSRTARCVTMLQEKANQEVDTYRKWKQHTEDELAILLAE